MMFSLVIVKRMEDSDAGENDTRDRGKERFKKSHAHTLFIEEGLLFGNPCLLEKG